MNEVSYLQQASLREMAEFLMEDRSISLQEALEVLSRSNTLEKLMDTKTGLYSCSPAHSYEYLKGELESKEPCTRPTRT